MPASVAAEVATKRILRTVEAAVLPTIQRDASPKWMRVILRSLCQEQEQVTAKVAELQTSYQEEQRLREEEVTWEICSMLCGHVLAAATQLVYRRMPFCHIL